MTQSTKRADIALTHGFSFKSAFAISFAVVSPIIATYSVLGVAIQKDGAGAWWTFLIAMVGTLAVAVTFSRVGSRWPLEGSHYQWGSRLISRQFGWWAGWFVYVTYAIAMAAIIYGIVTFLPPALGRPAFGPWPSLGIAFLLLGFGTLLNITARRWLKILVIASITCEVLGSVGVGTILLFFHRHQPFSVLIGGGDPHVSIGSMGVFGMIGALAFVGWAYNGFVASADVAEETSNPSRAIPKALILCVSSIAIVALYLTLGIILSLPSISDVVNGTDQNPIIETIELALGKGLGQYLFIILMISFFAGLVAGETAMSRILWAFGRDGLMPGSRLLVMLRGKERLPINAVLASAGVCGILLFTGLQADVFGTLVEFTTAGFFVVYLMMSLAFLYRKIRGPWQDGVFTGGRFADAIAVLGVVWCTGELINVLWPRPAASVFLTWGTIIMTGATAIVGAVLFWSLRPVIRASQAELARLEPEIFRIPGAAAFRERGASEGLGSKLSD